MVRAHLPTEGFQRVHRLRRAGSLFQHDKQGKSMALKNDLDITGGGCIAVSKLESFIYARPKSRIRDRGEVRSVQGQTFPTMSIPPVHTCAVLRATIDAAALIPIRSRMAARRWVQNRGCRARLFNIRMAL